MEIKNVFNRIIMFCDYGVDDAAATVHIISHGKWNNLDIVPVGGNVPACVAFRNAHTVLSAAMRCGVLDGARAGSVRIVDTRKIIQADADIPDIHGTDGIGDFLEYADSGLPVVDFAEFKKEIESGVEDAENNGICVLSLGPCTVPAMLNFIPEKLVLMGGATNEPPNYGKYEFNEALDPISFRQLSEKADGVATLDTCHSDKLDFDNLHTDCELFDKFVAACGRLSRARGVRTVVYDYVAALYVTDPELFEVNRVRRADCAEYNELTYIIQN